MENLVTSSSLSKVISIFTLIYLYMQIEQTLRRNSLIVIALFVFSFVLVTGGFFLLFSDDTEDSEENPQFNIESATSGSLTVSNNGGPVNGGIQVRVPIKNETFTQNFTAETVQRDEFFTVEFSNNLSNLSDIGTVQIFKTNNGELESSIASITVANLEDE